MKKILFIVYENVKLVSCGGLKSIALMLYQEETGNYIHYLDIDTRISPVTKIWYPEKIPFLFFTM